jgi:hypothetical protein
VATVLSTDWLGWRKEAGRAWGSIALGVLEPGRLPGNRDGEGIELQVGNKGRA